MRRATPSYDICIHIISQTQTQGLRAGAIVWQHEPSCGLGVRINGDYVNIARPRYEVLAVYLGQNRVEAYEKL